MFATIETCNDGTITRACARMLNRAHGTAFSGSTTAVDACVALDNAGVRTRLIPAATLTGPDKARHTREVTRSRKAQARRAERKVVLVNDGWATASERALGGRVA